MPPHPPVPLAEIDGIIRHMAEQEAELRRLRRHGAIMRRALTRISGSNPTDLPATDLANARGIAATALVDCGDA